MTDERLMSSIPVAVRRTGLSRSTLYRLMESGQLAYCKVMSRRLIPETTAAGSPPGLSQLSAVSEVHAAQDAA